MRPVRFSNRHFGQGTFTDCGPTNVVPENRDVSGLVIDGVDIGRLPAARSAAESTKYNALGDS